jgi:hypothetical protein
LAGHLLNEKRKSILPLNVERVLMLQFNEKLWSAFSVQTVINAMERKKTTESTTSATEE